MMVCRDRETGPVHPSIGEAPSTGTLGIFLSVTTFMWPLPPYADGHSRYTKSARASDPIRPGLSQGDLLPAPAAHSWSAWRAGRRDAARRALSGGGRAPILDRCGVNR